MTPAALTPALQDAFWQAGEALMFHHTNPWELDDALTSWGYRVGPCEAQDLAGLDRVLARAADRPVPILPRMVAEGRMGKIGGVGYYRYPGGGGAVIDPLIEDLIREEAWFAKITRTEISDFALVTAMNAALGDSCARLLGDGAPEASVILALVEGLHYPENRPLSALGVR